MRQPTLREISALHHRGSVTRDKRRCNVQGGSSEFKMVGRKQRAACRLPGTCTLCSTVRPFYNVYNQVCQLHFMCNDEFPRTFQSADPRVKVW